MKFGLVKKLVLGICTVSAITYGTSAFFIFKLKPIIAPNMAEWLYVGGVLALGVLWTGFLGWLAARMLIRPLLRLSAAVDEAATGNLNVTVPDYRYNDEIARLNVSFQTMIANLKQMIADVSHNAASADSGAASLSSAINHATHQIETIAITIDGVAQGSAKQAESARMLLGSVEQATEAAAEVGRQAEHAIALSDTMTRVIADSGASFRSLVAGLETISATSESTLDIVTTLNRHAREIGKISSMVGEIAGQTQLLALNASIEAAHAGDHGLGFGVVANQIRKLASDSLTAGEQITQLVSQMQAQTEVVVRETGHQVKLVSHETAKGESVHQAMAEITSSAGETAEALQRIVVHIAAQAEHIRRTYEEVREISGIASSISDGASRVAGAAQEQTAVMEEIASSSELLRNQSEHLKQKAEAFRL